ncbi:restriction endonuclease subunit S [Cellulophaga baltica]|uniref:restriction endonuclease subunit S n=1 Tax=Cellulophaga baltica TaxID=76594 RepID=UPI002493F20D|nr:restriction endonuclease subunit S [Cellulophaga baltica]
MKNYPKYKDSQIGWLGKIPEHWEVKKTKYLFDITKRISGELGHNILSITQKGIKIKDTESGGGQLSMDYSKYQVVDKGNFGMNHMDLLTGFVDISKYDGVMSPDYRVFKLKDKDSDSRYMLYLFQKGYWDKLFFPLGQGSSELGRWRLPSDEFNLFQLPVPPKKEQITIANFLDNQTTQIKKFIELKKNTIELLKEKAYKLSVNGFDEPKHVNEWEDNFPIDWKILKAKWIFNEIKIKNKPKEELLAVTQNRGVLPKSMCSESFVSPDEKGLLSQKLVLKESFVISLRSFQGGIEFSYYQGIVSPAYTVFVIKEEFDNEKLRIFYKYFLKSKPFIELLNTIISGIRDGQNISFTDFSTLNIPIPDRKTQQAIYNLDKLIIEREIKAKKEIALIKEYQQSLISDAVTGKIDVREE